MNIRKTNFLYLILFSLFLVSGFCGLLYQIVWLRLAFASFGIITPVLSVVISVFMLGLAIGSWAGGRFMDRLSGSSGILSIVYYALAEFMIGVGGLIVANLFGAGRDLLLSAGSFDSFKYLLFSAVIIGASILPWCICMGATTPLMMKFIKELNRDDTRGFSYLYLANVIGAMCGTIVTAGFLIELLGFRHTLLVAVSFNFIIATVGLILWYKYRNSSKAVKVALKETMRKGADAFSGSSPLVFILFITGFASMAMEVVWTRAFTPVLQTTIYSFASILAVYLLATWTGSWLYRKDASAQKTLDTYPLMWRLAYFSLLPVIFSDPRIWRMVCLHDFKASQSFTLFSIFPFCAALGYLTPKLIDELSSGNPRIAGKLYAVNTVGCILGPLCAGYILLPGCGVRLSLVILALPFAGYLIYEIIKSWRRDHSRAVTSGITISALLAASIFIFSSYEDSPDYKSGIIRRDYAATVISCGEGMNKRLLVNGIGMTCLTTITKFMAHVPLSIRDTKHDSALVICLGMGTSFRSAFSWGIRSTAIELIPSVRDAFGYYFADADDILKSPDARIIVDDGRRFLYRTSEKFDIITIDPPPPVEASGSGLLYSKDFYDILKTRLKENGIMAQWFPGGEDNILESVAMAIHASFPHVRVFRSIEGWGYHFFASMQPFDMPSVKQFVARLPAAAKSDIAEWRTEGPGELYRVLLTKEVPFDDIVKAGSGLSITDDQPFNEYFLVRRLNQRIKGTAGS